MSEPRLISIAIFAVGGQGGGVLSDWIVSLARRHNWSVQSTAVAGVAQRTGATFYYIEMAEPSERRPVFALAPSAGNVDIVIAAELMEAGRAMMRGLVSPDKTTLVASSHRMLSVAEKVVPGDGIQAPDDVLQAAELASASHLILDLQKIAAECGTVISASLFGALAASKALPFDTDSYLETIAEGGRGVAASSSAFNRVLAVAAGESDTASANDGVKTVSSHSVSGPADQAEAWQQLLEAVRTLPELAQSIAVAGLRKVVDYQDPGYGAEYVERLQTAAAGDSAGQYTATLAKHLANAMCYDDVIRVADLKTRATRRARIEAEYGADNSLVQTTEFMRPRMQEIASLLPPSLSGWLNNRTGLMKWLNQFVNRGRRVRSDRVLPFLLLYSLAGLRRWRRSMARHQVELHSIDQWLSQAAQLRQQNYELAIEVLNCRRLIKGYSDTHSRGLSKFHRVMDVIPTIQSNHHAAEQLRRLIDAALLDSEGQQLDEAIDLLTTAAI